MTDAAPKLRGFLSYAHADHKMVDEMRDHLGCLSYEFGLTFWEDRSIHGGDLWKARLADEIDSANCFVLAITHNWLGSKFIRETE